jgi:hypothetical protein
VTFNLSYSLNLCDVAGSPTLGNDPRTVLNALVEREQQRCGGTFDRLYVGSYFCERLFLSLDDRFMDAVATFAGDFSLRLTLVLPVFGQATLDRGTERTRRLLDPACTPFDEVVVNDPATATRLASELNPTVTRLSLGRLFAKAPRDPRYPDARREAQRCPLDAEQAAVAKAAWHPALAELDPFAPVIDATALGDALPLALHLPHALMSTGRVCEAASTGVPARRAFRPGMPCAQQCLAGVDVCGLDHTPAGEPVWLTRQGRTVFFENPDCTVVGAPVTRVVWAPADFLCDQSTGGQERQTPNEGGSAWA